MSSQMQKHFLKAYKVNVAKIQREMGNLSLLYQIVTKLQISVSLLHLSRILFFLFFADCHFWLAQTNHRRTSTIDRIDRRNFFVEQFIDRRRRISPTTTFDSLEKRAMANRFCSGSLPSGYQRNWHQSRGKNFLGFLFDRLIDLIQLSIFCWQIDWVNTV